MGGAHGDHEVIELFEVEMWTTRGQNNQNEYHMGGTGIGTGIIRGVNSCMARSLGW